jgi:hypothetical protein
MHLRQEGWEEMVAKRQEILGEKQERLAKDSCGGAGETSRET